MLTAIIIDDEAPGRQLLKDMLASLSGVAVVGEFARGEDALDLLIRDPPDVLFLDINMPGSDGFGVLNSIPRARQPAVVFVTAHQHHAHAAFDVGAIDYLLKPLQLHRLEQAVERVRRRIAERAASASALAAGMPPPHALAEPPLERIVVRDGERSYFVSVGDVIWLESDGKLVRIHSRSGVHEIRESLTRLDERLDPKTFVRVSRSAVINIDRIREVQTWFHGDRIVVMDTGDTVTTTKGFRDRLLRLLGG